MTNLNIGQLIIEKQERDAIHVAVAPVVAKEKLFAGQDIGFVDDSFISAGAVKPFVGIVDPFLKQPVFPGQEFWMFIYPNTITSLRHEWTHPLFKPAETENLVSKSVDWVTEFAKSEYLTYEEILIAATNYLNSGDYLCDGGKWEGSSVPDEFWEHYGSITGRKTNEDERGSFFSCSC